MIGDLVLLGVVFLVGYSFGYEDLLLDGKPRQKSGLSKLAASAAAKRKAYLDKVNSEPQTAITE